MGSAASESSRRNELKRTEYGQLTKIEAYGPRNTLRKDSRAKDIEAAAGGHGVIWASDDNIFVYERARM